MHIASAGNPGQVKYHILKVLTQILVLLEPNFGFLVAKIAFFIVFRCIFDE